MIFCQYTKLVPLAELREHPRNPNRHDIMQVSLLAEVIKLNGWRKPIVVSSLSGCIVKGHCRFAAAQKLGLVEAPVEFQDYESEGAELADMVADNRIAEFAKIDSEGLNQVLAKIRESDLPVLAAGFRDSDFALPEADPEDEEASDAPDEPAESVFQKGKIGQYGFTFTVEQQNKWLEELYAAVGNQEADVVAEIKRRIKL